MENMLVRPVHVKANTVDQAQGLATFVVSVFGNEDLGGDVVVPGAFTKVIGSQKRMPKFAPNHDLSVEKRLGKVLGWRETPEGLEIDAQFNLEKQLAKEVFSDFLFDPMGQEFSFSYEPAPDGVEFKGGIRYLKSMAEVMDVGPVGLGMNPRTHLVGAKGGSGPATDDSAWDKGRAMGACTSAADYRQVSGIEHNAGEPDQAQHWALPHHYLGKPANAAGVAAARARFGQTQDLKNAGAARTHLFSTHSLPSDSGKSVDELVAEAKAVEEKTGRTISAKTESKIQQAVDLLSEVLGSVRDQAPSDTATGNGKAEDPSDWDKADDHPVLTAARKEWEALLGAEEGDGQ